MFAFCIVEHLAYPSKQQRQTLDQWSKAYKFCFPTLFWHKTIPVGGAFKSSIRFGLQTKSVQSLKGPLFSFNISGWMDWYLYCSFNTFPNSSQLLELMIFSCYSCINSHLQFYLIPFGYITLYLLKQTKKGPIFNEIVQFPSLSPKIFLIGIRPKFSSEKIAHFDSGNRELKKAWYSKAFSTNINGKLD